MWIIISILLAGIVLGYLLRKRLKEKLLSRFLLFAIYLLLFMLGVSIGTNKQVLDNLATLGMQSLAITAGTVIGSIFVVYFVFIFFFQKK